MGANKFLSFKGLQVLVKQLQNYINTRIAQIIDSAPESLDTLNELSNALGQDANFAATVTELIGKKADQDSLDEIGTRVSELANMFYPIGSIYISVIDNDPQTMFGGVWTRLENQFLLGASDIYEAGSMGGESSHTLTTNELPSHDHKATVASNGAHTHKIGTDKDTSYTYSGECWSVHNSSSGASYLNGYTNSAGSHTHSVTISSTGAGKAHNNMPPYLAVYMWKRVA